MSESDDYRTVKLSPTDALHMSRNLEAAIEFVGSFNRFFSTTESADIYKRLEETRGNLLVAINRERTDHVIAEAEADAIFGKQETDDG